MNPIRTTLTALATAALLAACGPAADNHAVHTDPAASPAGAEDRPRLPPDAIDRWRESGVPAGYYPHGFDWTPDAESGVFSPEAGRQWVPPTQPEIFSPEAARLIPEAVDVDEPVTRQANGPLPY